MCLSLQDPSETDPHVKEISHGAVVIKKTDQFLHLAPITNHPRGSRTNYDQASKYVKGTHQKSQVNVGRPYQVHESKVNPNGFTGFKVHDFQGLKDKVDGTNHSGTPSGSGQQHGGGAAGTQAKANPPNNSAFRNRNPAPPNQPKYGHSS